MRRPATKAKPAPTPATTPVAARPPLPAWLIAALLVLVTIALYWPSRRFDFVNYDDPRFVTSNAQVQGGLTWQGVKWAFQPTQAQGDYWHPLTWLSLMLDVSLFGQGAGGLHLTNVALHAANSVLLFLLLRLLTGTLWRSVMVAALFALHPLRVESVAWVTERKDVLSTCFGFLSLLFYVRYAQKSVISNQSSVTGKQSSRAAGGSHGQRIGDDRLLITGYRLLYFLLSLFFLACGLMSKAIMVTLPCVMLLLDYWPLRRLEPFSARRARSPWLQVVREKIPFFALSGLSCVITYVTQQAMEGSVTEVGSPVQLRLENAVVAYTRYLGKTFWPVNLAVPYTQPDRWPGLEVAGSVGVVVGLCLAAFWWGRRWPYLLVGWCWFLGTLIPMIGLTKGWGAFMADRFTYVPSVGVLVFVVWGMHELTRRWRHQMVALATAGSAALVLCLAVTRQQLGHWKNSEALFRHALDVTENNSIAHKALGDALDKPGQVDEAIRQFQEAIRLNPDYALARNNLGIALLKKGQVDEAIREHQEAIRLSPGYAEARYNLGNTLLTKGEVDAAIRQLQDALRLKPDYADAHNNLGAAFGRKGQVDEAIRQYQEALRLKPDSAEAHNNLGTALGEKGQIDEAIRHFQEAIRLKPDHAFAHNNLGIAFYHQGRTSEAAHQFQEALRLQPDFADARKNLDAVLDTNTDSSTPPGAPTNP